jgi:uncharacterized protein YrrD
MSELLSAAEGRKVVSRADAEDVGTVKTAVFDKRLQRVISLQVGGGKRNAQLIEWDDVAGFGPDAVVIDDAERLRDVREERESEAVRGDVHPIGARVLDDLGDAHGAVRDVRFDPNSGTVEAIISDQGEWKADDVCALGTYALVVRHR